MSLTNSLILVKPTYFGCNYYKRKNPVYTRDDISNDFNSLIKTLKDKKINVLVYESPKGACNAVYPNNWISMHWETSKPTLILYPMINPVRRLERKSKIVTDIISHMSQLDIIDFTEYEKSEIFLESTGSMVFDRHNKIAYCCLSSRTNPHLAKLWAERLQYQMIIFKGYDRKDVPIYHTNIMMMVGNHFAIICLQSIKDAKEKHIVRQSLISSGKQIIDIDYDQMEAFCANCLQVLNRENQTILCMAKSAFDCFTDDQIKDLKIFNTGGFAVVDYYVIGDMGNGSVRCSILESFPIIEN